MSIDRSKFKGGSLNDIKKEQQESEKNIPKTGGDFEGRSPFHKIEDGKNIFRIACAHDSNDPAYRAKSATILECEVDELDDEFKETGKKVVKSKSIFIATQHSEMSDDPILAYIDFVQRKANDEIQDKDERSKFLSPINGWRSKYDNKWNWGIKPNTEYICYAWDENKVLGRLTLYSKMLDDMKKKSVEKTDDNAAIVPDIFTDPDEGYELIISKETEEVKGKKKTVYDISYGCSKNKKDSEYDYLKSVALTDEQLNELESKESLTELYKNVYTLRDFNMAVDGLMRFDKKHGFAIFENEEFIERLEKLKKQVPAYVPKIKGEQPVDEMIVDKRESKKEESKSEQKEEMASVPIPKMKRLLKEYIADNYGDDYELPSDLTSTEVKEWYDLSVAGEELPFDTTDDEPAKPEPVKETKTEAKSVEKVEVKTEKELPGDVADQIARLRARRATKG